MVFSSVVRKTRERKMTKAEELRELSSKSIKTTVIEQVQSIYNDIIRVAVSNAERGEYSTYLSRFCSLSPIYESLLKQKLKQEGFTVQKLVIAKPSGYSGHDNPYFIQVSVSWSYLI